MRCHCLAAERRSWHWAVDWQKTVGVGVGVGVDAGVDVGVDDGDVDVDDVRGRSRASLPAGVVVARIVDGTAKEEMRKWQKMITASLSSVAKRISIKGTVG